MVKVTRSAIPADIPRQTLSQASLCDQLTELVGWANRLGLYDAADLVQNMIKTMRPNLFKDK